MTKKVRKTIQEIDKGIEQESNLYSGWTKVRVDRAVAGDYVRFFGAKASVEGFHYDYYWAPYDGWRLEYLTYESM